MIPQSIRLYSWIDVEDVLNRQTKNWPNSLVWASAYWEGLTLGIRAEGKSKIQEWLKDTYDPRIEEKEGELYLIMESAEKKPKRFPIFLEETDEEPMTPRMIPSLARPNIITPHLKIDAPEIFSEDFPPVVVFHSFKGGVGRTIHAMALAKVFADDKKKVILIDADFEAPGISWLLRERFPNPSISFSDLIALIHGDLSKDKKDSLDLVKERLQDAFLDGIFLLPAYRSVEDFVSLDIRPEHLIQNADDPFLLTKILSELGKAMDVDAVIVDTRAGLSELSTGLLLDPRTYRVLVTTLSSQSMEGTYKVLKLLIERTPSKKEDVLFSIEEIDFPKPFVIMSQIPLNMDEKLWSEKRERLNELIAEFGCSDDLIDENLIDTPFDSNLFVLPSTFEEIMERLNQSNLRTKILDLKNYMPCKESLKSIFDTDINEKRKKVAAFSNKMQYAEKSEETDFLVTTPLKKLVEDHRQRVPITVVVGAKGAGKTYTYMQIIRCGKWSQFVEKCGMDSIHNDILICPFLEPKNLEETNRSTIQEAREKVIRQLSMKSRSDNSTIRDSIRDGMNRNLHEGQWKQIWLNGLAWSVGFRNGESEAGTAFPKFLTEQKKRVIFLIDGLEDLFQHLASSHDEQNALRSLIQEVPEWLGQQPSRPIGIVVFVRRDMVLGAISQNAAQLMALYEPYSLQWNELEALRLIGWLTEKTDIISHAKSIQAMRKEELIESLIPFWGKKLGHDQSRESRTSAWVMAVLSDLRGQIQARDMVRFIYYSVKYSIDDQRWKDRILVPSAMKKALPECGRKKIEEVEAENNPVQKIFNKFRSYDQEKKKVPFQRTDFNLDDSEIFLLENNGVIKFDKGEYHMSEIFRLGLDFERKKVGRSKVLGMASQANLREL
ncbi:MAG: ParA family protein [Candidatus Omnitrophota bacterium]|jgi:MinD-like ATPase involved in chromosome partitioning or flagellar assembly|nr:MAG: ParA family protein [Candidatus Omnitrophota bacterium]